MSGVDQGSHRTTSSTCRCTSGMTVYPPPMPAGKPIGINHGSALVIEYITALSIWGYQNGTRILGTTHRIQFERIWHIVGEILRQGCGATSHSFPPLSLSPKTPNSKPWALNPKHSMRTCVRQRCPGHSSKDPFVKADAIPKDPCWYMVCLCNTYTPRLKDVG